MDGFSKVKAKKEIILVSKRLKALGILPGASGNTSIKLKDRILITPSMVDKEDLNINNISEIDFKGNMLNSVKPSSEYMLHLEIYKKRKDANAIIHTHPPYTVAYSISKIEPDYNLTVEFKLIVKNIKFCSFEKPGTVELAKKVADMMDDTNCVIMENHGLVVCAEDLSTAKILTEEVENFFRINFLVKLLKYWR